MAGRALKSAKARNVAPIAVVVVVDAAAAFANECDNDFLQYFGLPCLLAAIVSNLLKFDEAVLVI